MTRTDCITFTGKLLARDWSVSGAIEGVFARVVDEAIARVISGIIAEPFFDLE